MKNILKENPKNLFPQISEEELEKYFKERVDFWKKIIENYKNIDFNKVSFLTDK